MDRRFTGDVLMTIAVLLRSGMMGNYHVPFWRAVEEVTPSLTLIILRKVATTLRLCLEGVSSGASTTPVRVHYWATCESPSL